MSFKQLNELDRFFLGKLAQQIRILKFDRKDWNAQDVARFLNLIKIDDMVGRDIKSCEIDGGKLFDLEYLSYNIGPSISETNFFPMYKLLFIVSALLEIEAEQDVVERSKKSELLKKETMKVSQIETFIKIEEVVIVKLKQQLAKIYNQPVMQLGSNQLYRLLKAANLGVQSDIVKKYNVDGFSLVCIIANSSEDQTIKNYYAEEEIKLLQKLSQIFVHLYYCQYFELQVQKKMGEQTGAVDEFNVEFNDINLLQQDPFQFDVKRSMANSEFGTSEDGGAESNQPEEITTQQKLSIRQSELGVSMRGSVMNSQMGVSQRGSIKNSQYAQSQRGSVRNSITQSVYANSEIMQDGTFQTKKDKVEVVRASTYEDESMLKVLGAIALSLPFNLLNLQPIQHIKISSISYPFNLGKGMTKKESKCEGESPTAFESNQKSEGILNLIESNEEVKEFKIFNLSGAKFGRAPENDFSYPDELSISSKHAQIVFKDESYYIRDLGSKTGTFLYISEKNPLVLADEQIIQLSYQVEFKVLIVKSEVHEGIIKFEFKKPDNQPPYRAILKNNNTVRIGKAEKSHIRLTNQSISSYHAQIRYQNGKFLMFDCNTRTGTWLRLSGKGMRSVDRKLAKHDIIRISSKKTFLIEDVTDSIQFQCCQFSKKNG